MAARPETTAQTLSWKVGGMDCASCAAKIRGAVERLPGVSDVRLSVMSETLKAIGVKAAVAHRRAYDKIARGSFTVATPGPCTSRISGLPYKRLRRPVFPLD